jgi:hypothetical protein
MCEKAREREIPPGYYVPLHPGASLNRAEIGALYAVTPHSTSHMRQWGKTNTMPNWGLRIGIPFALVTF